MSGLLPHRQAGPRWLACSLLAAIAVAGLGVWFLGARPPAWYPPCLFHALTGLHCPGCGSSRTIHALLHGEWGRAWALNPLLVLGLPFAAVWVVQSFWRALRHDLSPVALPGPVARITLVVVLAFWILRNLPWWPFALLAPHG